MSDTCGVLFVATGQGYVNLAVRAASMVRQHCPGLAIDLFTDQPLESPFFDRVVLLQDPWFRSRIDAIQMTRFDRTLHLDADVMVVADVRDVFEILERFDIALAHDQHRNGPGSERVWRRQLPNAFPQFNGGVIAYRKTAPVLALFETWAQVMRQERLKKDQPVLRELLWDSDLRVATLPEEYNLMEHKAVATWSTVRAAPRIFHHMSLHHHFTGDRRFAVESVEELVGPVVEVRLPILLAADKSLARMAGKAPREPVRRKHLERLRVAGAYLRVKSRKAARRIRHWFAKGRAGAPAASGVAEPGPR